MINSMDSFENMSISIQELDNPSTDLSNKMDLDSEELLNDMFAISKKKKKKDKDKIAQGDKTSIEDKEENKKVSAEEKKSEDNCDKPTYTYGELLNRLYNNFQNKDTVFANKKITIKPPNVQRIGTKKTGWMNFTECCARLNRDSTHLHNFTVNELSTEANIDGNGYFIIKGRYNQKNIENVLRKYVTNYVQCSLCKSLETLIKKDSATRISFLECLSCKSNKALQNINIGFKANFK